jgi:hypothetical protein
VGLYSVPVYLGTKPLILQIQRSWFCSIWSPKTEFIDKTVNSFQLNSKKIKRKKKVKTSRTKPGRFGPAVRTTVRPVRQTVGIAQPSSAPHPFFFFFS